MDAHCSCHSQSCVKRVGNKVPGTQYSYQMHCWKPAAWLAHQRQSLGTLGSFAPCTLRYVARPISACQNGNEDACKKPPVVRQLVTSSPLWMIHTVSEAFGKVVLSVAAGLKRPRLGTIWHRWSDRTTDVSRCSRYDLFADVHAPYLEIPLRVFLMPVKVCRWFQCRA